MIDATTGYKSMSFMDSSSGCNQIRMTPMDEELTLFHTPKGIYCYKMMSFGLKNAGATYQRAMQNIFDDLLYKNVECYVDDLVSVINQLLGNYEVKKLELRSYHDYAQKLIGWLGDVTLQHVRRTKNKKIDALAALASTLTLLDQTQSPEVLHPTIASWPFDTWGLDVVGPLPKSSGGHLYILAATYYFSKCSEVVALKEVKKENVANFIRVNIIYRFGIPRYIITNNGKPFDNKLMNKICDLFGFKQRKFSMYHAAANGLAEAFNKTLCNLLKKVVSKSKRDWHERMEEALWAFRTTCRTPTQATPYSLTFGIEAVLPLERQIPSLRLVIQEGITEEENA
ncbi:uncharacterized protein LOC125836723 [Solanum verrucosum]|uniref:uncharacterized protein LOC125836723 n=1 Tax=Solanum verrucosum TaxID=315347 RepID=UPI0020D09058|nr:uncharacterized protein LOC125836723 [Solanum verrucosum]